MGPDAGRCDSKGIWAISAIYVGDGPNAGGDLGNPHRFTLPAVKDGHRDGDQRRGDHRRSRQKLRSAGQPRRRHQDASRVSGEPSLFGRTVGSGLNPNGPRRALGRLELAAKRVEGRRYRRARPGGEVPAVISAKKFASSIYENQNNWYIYSQLPDSERSQAAFEDDRRETCV